MIACEDSFDREEEVGSNGGDGQDDIDELDDCMDACRDDDECLGFDWTLDDEAETRCWLHTDEDQFKESGDNSGSDQYTRKDCNKVDPTPGKYCLRVVGSL